MPPSLAHDTAATSPTTALLRPALEPPRLINKDDDMRLQQRRRPQSSSCDSPNRSPLPCLDTAKAAQYEPDSQTPSTAVPALGGTGTVSGTAGTTTVLDTEYQTPAIASLLSASATRCKTQANSGDSQQQQHTTGQNTLDFPSTSPSTIPPHLPSHQAAPTMADCAINRTKRPEALSLNSVLSSTANTNNTAPAHESAASVKLTDALNDLARRQSTSLPPSSGMTAAAGAATATTATGLTTMRSPCFYHQRFDDAVDIDKVLEEIKNDESMSHSRLVQTATSVREVSKQLQRRPIRRAVRNVMIVTKARDNQLVHLTRQLAGWLLRTPRYGSDTGVCVYVDAKLRRSKRFNAAGLVAENPAAFENSLRYWNPDLCWSQPDKFDLVLTLGGDGTVLFTSWLFQRVVPPVLSFSLGSLGFMTTFDFDQYRAHLGRIMGDDGMKINLRMRFTCTVWRAGALHSAHGEGEQFEVLNELVIDRGPSPYVSNLELYGDDELLTVVQADGCIFSTPTGSTAYSLSAGGSLVHPDIPAILLTPICPHTLSFRPMVLSDTMALRVAVPRSSRATAYCSFDGKGRIELRQGDHVTITASQYPFPTVTRTDTEWFDSVSRTLRWNTRAAAQKPFDSSAASECGGGGADEEAGEEGEEDWDIDTDSAYYASEEGSLSTSPIHRQMSMLGL